MSLCRSGSSGSSVGATSVVTLVPGRLLPLGAPLVSLVSFWFVWFVCVHPGGLLVRSGLTASFGSALGVAGFAQVRLVRSRAL